MASITVTVLKPTPAGNDTASHSFVNADIKWNSQTGWITIEDLTSRRVVAGFAPQMVLHYQALYPTTSVVVEA